MRCKVQAKRSMAGTGQPYIPISVDVTPKWGVLRMYVSAGALYLADDVHVPDMTYYLFHRQSEAIRDNWCKESIECQARLYPDVIHIQCEHTDMQLADALKFAEAPFTREKYFVQDLQRTEAPTINAALEELTKQIAGPWPPPLVEEYEEEEEDE